MTESGGPYCGARLDVDLPAAKHGSCGRPFDGIEVRVVDPDSRNVVPADVQGEIQLRGPNMIRGICGRTRSELFDAEGYSRRATSAASTPTAISGTRVAATTCSR